MFLLNNRLGFVSMFIEVVWRQCSKNLLHLKNFWLLPWELEINIANFLIPNNHISLSLLCGFFPKASSHSRFFHQKNSGLNCRGQQVDMQITWVKSIVFRDFGIFFFHKLRSQNFLLPKCTPNTSVNFFWMLNKI